MTKYTKYLILLFSFCIVSATSYSLGYRNANMNTFATIGCNELGRLHFAILEREYNIPTSYDKTYEQSQLRKNVLSLNNQLMTTCFTNPHIMKEK